MSGIDPLTKLKELAAVQAELETVRQERDQWQELALARANLLATAEHRANVAEEQMRLYSENNAKYQTAARQFQSTLQDILEGK